MFRKPINFKTLLEQKKEIQKVYEASEKDADVEKWYQAEMKHLNDNISAWKASVFANLKKSPRLLVHPQETETSSAPPQSPPFQVFYAEDEEPKAPVTVTKMKSTNFLRKGKGALAFMQNMDKKSNSLPPGPKMKR